MSEASPEDKKLLLGLIIKDIQVTADAPQGLGRQITEINLFFDFQTEEQSDTHKLLNKLYPDWDQQIRHWGTNSTNQRGTKLWPLFVLPLLMVRFSVIWLSADFYFILMNPAQLDVSNLPFHL